jgi:predicted MPP superfamily phosphohydrolase
MITRRKLLAGLGIGATATLSSAGAIAAETTWGLRIAEYHIAPRHWPADFTLDIAVLADIHAVEPWMPIGRIRAIVDAANGLKPDLVLLAGDYETGLAYRETFTRTVPMSECADALSELDPPLGAYAVLGNHDLWTCRGDNVRRAFAAKRIPLLENQVVRLTKRNWPFWLVGLGDQWAFPTRTGGFIGLDNLPGCLARIKDEAPIILLAHEPDIFPSVPDRVSVTICGHTHGGQVALPLVGPLRVPSRYGTRYAYGHIRENGRDLVVSAGLGVSGLPIRFGVPPEIAFIRLGFSPAGQSDRLAAD